MMSKYRMDLHLGHSWEESIGKEFDKDYFKQLKLSVEADYLLETIFPQEEEIFNAFINCPFENVRVVILGQDPYHGEGQAHGLAFSVPEGVQIPPSLRNIYKEITADTGTTPPQSGNLERLAKQGILLLNSTLTVQAGFAGSHKGLGWEQFTDAVVKKISDEKAGVVFMLWGKYAQDKGAHIDQSKHLVLKSAHPSPLSAYAGFFGSKPFSQCNAYLARQGGKTINW
jgi:uracil-DNA glycosylase